MRDSGGVRRLFRTRLCGAGALYLDRAVLHHRDEHANRREHRRQQHADDAGRQRKLRHRAALALDDYAADVALVDQRLERLDDLITLTP
jgi:hypothetical protein